MVSITIKGLKDGCHIYAFYDDFQAFIKELQQRLQEWNLKGTKEVFFHLAHHTMEEIFDFDRTLGIDQEWAEKAGETLDIVTADHATGGMTLLSGSIAEKRIKVNFSTAGHNGIALPVFAWGPHSEDFVGIYENTER